MEHLDVYDALIHTRTEVRRDAGLLTKGHEFNLSQLSTLAIIVAAVTGIIRGQVDGN